MKRLLAICVLLGLSLSTGAHSFAATTLLPSGETESFDASDYTVEECNADLDFLSSLASPEEIKNIVAEQGSDFSQLILFCALKTGQIEFWMLGYFVRYILEFLIGLAGLISILFILIGAYYYIAGGLTDDKEKGKTIIQYALGGLVLSSLAWIIVNLILLFITS